MPGDVDITRLLNQAARGDAEAARAVFPAIYQELRDLASAKLSRIPPGGTLQTTALVHEAYLRAVGRSPEGWAGMRHFYFAAARAMRDILVEEARRQSSLKRGGDLRRVELDEDAVWSYDISPDEVLSLESALDKLEREDLDAHRIVLLHVYTGLTLPEIADLVGHSTRTIERRWRFLRNWLAREMEAGSRTTHASGADSVDGKKRPDEPRDGERESGT
jgi:RNA polymerase sigma factor (TIGR02999 family)